jgi:predicted NAD/FAD-dependent oxidoreductase
VLSWLLAGEDAMVLSNFADGVLVAKVLDSLPGPLADGKGLFVEGHVDRWIGSVNAQPGGIPLKGARRRHRPAPEEHPALVTVGDYLFDSTINGVMDSADIATDVLLRHLRKRDRSLPRHRPRRGTDGAGGLKRAYFDQYDGDRSYREAFAEYFDPRWLVRLIGAVWGLEPPYRLLGAGSASGLTLKALARALAAQRLPPEERHKRKHFIHALIEQEYAADLADLSLWHWDEVEEFYGANVLFPGGYDQVAVRLAEGLDVRTGHAVRRIASRRKRVRVRTSRGPFEADRIVVTLPLGVLQAGAVRFDPPLPRRKQEAIAHLRMGVLNKLCLRFGRPFWPPDHDWLEYMGGPGGAWAEFFNLHRYAGAPVLVAFNAGSQALRLEALPDADVVAEATAALRRMFGASAPDPDGWRLTRWASDPFARGSYCHIPPGASGEDIDALAEPVDERVFFAGEATHRAHYGTVQGAYLSGVRAADLIAEPARWRVGDRLRLTVREPESRWDARATLPASYRPSDFAGRVEGVSLAGANPRLEVRWHLPGGSAADTRKGVVSTLVHIANGVWLEARRRPRNVAVTLERISREEYEQLVRDAARG